MKQMTRLVIPMERTMRTALVKRAKELGFDSAQALMRYMIKALLDHRPILFSTERGTPLVFSSHHESGEDKTVVDNV